MAAFMEGHAGRALKFCQLKQGAMASTQQKAMVSLSSAPNTTDTAFCDEVAQPMDEQRAVDVVYLDFNKW